MCHVIVLSHVSSPITHETIGLKLQLYFMENDCAVGMVPDVSAILKPNDLRTLLLGNGSEAGVISSIIDLLNQPYSKSSKHGTVVPVLNEVYAKLLFTKRIPVPSRQFPSY